MAGGAAAVGQRGAASPRGFGGATPCRGSPTGGAGRALGVRHPPYGGLIAA